MAFFINKQNFFIQLVKNYKAKLIFFNLIFCGKPIYTRLFRRCRVLLFLCKLKIGCFRCCVFYMFNGFYFEAKDWKTLINLNWLRIRLYAGGSNFELSAGKADPLSAPFTALRYKELVLLNFAREVGLPISLRLTESVKH